MQRSVVGAASGAIVTSLATLVCCLPAGLLGAAGGSAVAAFLFDAGRPWMLGLSLGFLALGFVQAYRAKRCGAKPNRWALGLLVFALLMVMLAAIFPQVIAGFFADYGSWK